MIPISKWQYYLFWSEFGKFGFLGTKLITINFYPFGYLNGLTYHFHLFSILSPFIFAHYCNKKKIQKHTFFI